MFKYLLIYKIFCIELFPALTVILPLQRLTSHPALEASAACQMEVSCLLQELSDVDRIENAQFNFNF